MHVNCGSGIREGLPIIMRCFFYHQFMDYVLNFGQGLFIFALFALDTRIIVLPIVRKIRHAVSRLQCDGQRRFLHGDVTGPVATKN